MDNYWTALMVAAAALATTFGLAWRFRVRAVKRRLRALDAYADLELARERGEYSRMRVERDQAHCAGVVILAKLRTNRLVSHGVPERRCSTNRRTACRSTPVRALDLSQTW